MVHRGPKRAHKMSCIVQDIHMNHIAARYSHESHRTGAFVNTVSRAHSWAKFFLDPMGERDYKFFFRLANNMHVGLSILDQNSIK